MSSLPDEDSAQAPGSFFEPSATTHHHFCQYASESTIEEVISKLETSGYPALGKVCYVSGRGDHPKSDYTELARRPGLEVVQFDSLAPLLLRWIPSYRGLIKISDPSVLGIVAGKLMELSMVVVLIFDAHLEEGFIEAVRTFDKHRDYSFGVRSDPGHLIYIVQEDRDDSPTGIFHFLSYGHDGPWKELFDLALPQRP